MTDMSHLDEKTDGRSSAKAPPSRCLPKLETKTLLKNLLLNMFRLNDTFGNKEK